MSYKKPKKHLHREFLYLNQDSIINSLSALEAGKVDEILQKANEVREGGFSAGPGGGGLDVSGGKKKASNIEEEMVRTRTVFSAFEAWYSYLKDSDAIGTFSDWNLDVRNRLRIGDTIEFEARVELSPVHRVLRTYINFAEQAETPGSVFQQKGQELAETKKISRMMQTWLGGKDAPNDLSVYMAPFEKSDPRIVARLSEEHMLSPKEGIDGMYKIIAQVDDILRPEDELSAIRIIREVPPTPLEVKTISEALSNLTEGAEGLGVKMSPEDISVPFPAVVLRPLAVYR